MNHLTRRVRTLERIERENAGPCTECYEGTRSVVLHLTDDEPVVVPPCPGCGRSREGSMIVAIRREPGEPASPTGGL